MNPTYGGWTKSACWYFHRGIIIAGLLRWCRTSSTHSISSQEGHPQQNNQQDKQPPTKQQHSQNAKATPNKTTQQNEDPELLHRGEEPWRRVHAEAALQQLEATRGLCSSGVLAPLRLRKPANRQRRLVSGCLLGIPERNRQGF